MNYKDHNWRMPPRVADVKTAHDMFADWMLANKKINDVQWANYRRHYADPDTYPDWGMLVAARLIALGADATKVKVISDFAEWMGAAMVNADYDIERPNMKSSEKPFDNIRSNADGFMAALVQSLLDAQPGVPASGQTFTDGYRAALDVAITALQRLK